jgi:alanine dehydrogenase
MPGGVPMTSTLALNAVTLPFTLKLAQNGYKNALTSDANFLAGLNICKGSVTYKAVADDLGYDYVNPDKAVN